jgi:hypothetical protein
MLANSHPMKRASWRGGRKVVIPNDKREEIGKVPVEQKDQLQTLESALRALREADAKEAEGSAGEKG